MIDRDRFVSDLEQTIEADEAALEQQIFRARGHHAGVYKRLQSVVASIHAAQAGRDDPAKVRALGDRASELVVPKIPLEAHYERQIDIREDAVRARRWVVTTMEQELERFERDLIYLEAICEEVEDDLADSGLMSALKSTRTKRRERVTAPTVEEPAIAHVSIARTQEFAAPKRQHRRSRMSTTIDLQSASNFFTGFSENLSDGGVFVATERALEIGSDVDIAFTVPNPDGRGEPITIRTRARVCWARTTTGESDLVGGVGLKFIALSETSRVAIKAFMDDRDPIFYPG